MCEGDRACGLEGHLWLLGQGWLGTMRQPWGSPLRRSPWQAALRKAGLLGWAWGKFGRRAQSRERHRGKYPRSPAYPESLGGKWDSSSLVPARSPHPAEGVVISLPGGWPQDPLRPASGEQPRKEPREPSAKAAGRWWVPGHR